MEGVVRLREDVGGWPDRASGGALPKVGPVSSRWEETLFAQGIWRQISSKTFVLWILAENVTTEVK